MSYYKRKKRRNDWRRFWYRRGVSLKAAIRAGAELIVVLVIAAAVLRALPVISRFLHPAGGESVVLLPAEELSGSTVSRAPESIPDYSGEDVIFLEGNRPNFTEDDLQGMTGAVFSELDRLGRCGPAAALLDRSMMPQEERGEIGRIRPTGWHTVKYPDLIEDNYLYNRCHLIAYRLSGENDNEKNLITGTRHMNTVSMLPYEVQVMRYLDHSENHVLYRVTPYFAGDELVARGVEMEAYSVEDRGEGVCFHVFVYNVQPGIDVDYATGESQRS